jgi:hypothetical protein
MKTVFCLCIPLIFLNAESFGQLTDSVVLERGKEYVRTIHGQAMENTQNLYNGSEYVAKRGLTGEHPFFLTDLPVPGNLRYSGEEFSGVPILFDIVNQQLVLTNRRYGTLMALQHEWIDGFTLGGHQFINPKNLSGLRQDVFYENLYSGKTQVLAQHVKLLKETVQARRFIRKFEASSHYYMKVDGQFVRITSRGDLLKALITKKRELKSYIRKNNLFVQNREFSIVQVARYYDTLTP